MRAKAQPVVSLLLVLSFGGLSIFAAEPNAPFDATAEVVRLIERGRVQPGDWPQWGGSSSRNNVSAGKNIPIDWDVETGRNIRWRAQTGSQTYGTPVVANGQVYVGTNNGAGYLKRYPNKVDVSCLLCFRESDGQFLWQHSSEKLPTGRVHDWPLQGIGSTPLVSGNRLWYVSTRCEVVCLDTRGFRDDEDDGLLQDELSSESNEADVVWKLDMMGQLGVSPHNMSSCSVTAAEGVLFVITGNGVDEGHISLPKPDAPSFVALDQATGEVLWTDNTPGGNVLNGQWSSPAYGVFAGQAQVLFPGGDGYLYAFDPLGDGAGHAKLLWKFDANPKESQYLLGGRATRNHFVATPVVYDGLVYIGVGESPEHGEGAGHLWCIDPTKRGDVSPELVFNKNDPRQVIPHKRLQAREPDKGDFTRANPDSAAVWHYAEHDLDGNGTIEFEEIMHRTCGTVAIKDDLLLVADFSGLAHCLDAKTGIPYWTHDLLAAAWGSALIVDDKVYFPDEDGDVTILALSKQKQLLAEVSVGNAMYATPVVAGNTLFLASKDILYAIQAGASSAPPRLRQHR